MRQKRVCEYLGLPCTHLRSFLDFPVAVRWLIYELVDLAVGQTIYLSPKQGTTFDYEPWNEFSVALGLLQTSKAVHDDVMAFLLSQNSVILPPTDIDYGLMFLSRLAPQHCYHLVDLHVHLQSGLALKKKPLLEAKNVAVWQKTARHILMHVKPKTLNLHLLCDTGDSDITSAILQPLLDVPGKLADCELRLAEKRDCRISTLALETACLATGNYLDPALRRGTFPFFKLPRELRLCILGYTDLVTPYREVRWSPETGFFCSFVLPDCDDEYCPTELHHGCQFRFCARGVSRYSTQFSWSHSFCRARHSSYSSACRCWITPGHLMRVSRAMYFDSIAVFYSQNRVSVTPARDVHYTNAKASTVPIDASRFITRHLWPDVLQHIRYLEIALPSSPETTYYYSNNDHAYNEWLRAINLLAKYTDVSKLTLAIHMSTASRNSCSTQSRLLKHMRTLLVLNETSLPLAYERLLTPLMNLHPLKRFFVFLEGPWNYSPHGCRNHSYYPEFDAVNRRAYRGICRTERQLEKLVMGDTYNSYAVGKKEEDVSQWLQCVWHTLP